MRCSPARRRGASASLLFNVMPDCWLCGRSDEELFEALTVETADGTEHEIAAHVDCLDRASQLNLPLRTIADVEAAREVITAEEP